MPPFAAGSSNLPDVPKVQNWLLICVEKQYAMGYKSAEGVFSISRNANWVNTDAHKICLSY